MVQMCVPRMDVMAVFDLDHEAVVGEGFRAEQAERPRDLPPPLVHAAGLQRPRDGCLAAHTDERDLRQAQLGSLDQGGF